MSNYNLEVIKLRMSTLVNSGAHVVIIDGAGSLVCEGTVTDHNSYWSIGGRNLVPERIKHINVFRNYIYLNPKVK